LAVIAKRLMHEWLDVAHEVGVGEDTERGAARFARSSNGSKILTVGPASA
jgi:hypothetical protein